MLQKNKDGAFWEKRPDSHHPVALFLWNVLFLCVVTTVITLVLDYDPRGREMQKYYAVDTDLFAFSIFIFAGVETIELRPLPRDSTALHEDLHDVLPLCNPT